MIRVLFADRDAWSDYEALLPRALDEAGVAAEVGLDVPPGEVDYIVTSPDAWLKDYRPYDRAKAVFNLWAGVEGIVGNENLTQPD